MHLPDNLLHPATAWTTTALSAGALGYAALRVRSELPRPKIPLAAAVTALVFAAQMFNFPVSDAASGHLLGGVLAAVVLGPWSALLCMGLVLLVQGCVFGDGGITALGANLLNMGIVSCLIAGVAARAARGRGARAQVASSGAAAWLAIVLGAALASFELAFGTHTPVGALLAAMLPVHALIGLGEAAVTALAVGLLLAYRPDLLHLSLRSKAVPVSDRAAGRWGAAGALALALVAAPLASSMPDGLEWSLAQLHVTYDAATAMPAPLADYGLPGVSAAWGTALAGTLGVALVFAAAMLIFSRPSKRHAPA